MDYTKLVCIGSGKQHHYNFTIFLGLGSFAENIYNDNLSLKAAKIKQRNMEDMIKKLEEIQIVKNTKQKKPLHFLMQVNFTKKEKLFLLHLKMVYFHCLNNIHQAWMIGKKMT